MTRFKETSIFFGFLFVLVGEKKTGGKFESFWMAAGAAAAASSLPWLTIAKL